MGTGSVVKCHFPQGSSMWWPLVNPGAVGGQRFRAGSQGSPMNKRHKGATFPLRG